MSRPIAVLGAVAVLAALLAPVTSAQAATNTVIKEAELQPKDPNKWSIEPDDPAQWEGITPDVAYNNNGTRIEVYLSVGDNDGGMDWRTVNEFSYLIASVPKGKKQYLTIFNSLYDGHDARRTKDTGTNRWQLKDATGSWKLNGVTTFGPNKALQQQLNLYETDLEASQYLKLLLAKESMREAEKVSGFAALVYKSQNGKNNLWHECSKSKTGGCLDSNTGALMHSKYALFEETKTSEGNKCEYGIWITSSNLNGSSGGKKSNTSILMCGDQPAYNQLKTKVWDNQWAENLNAYKASGASTGFSGSNADFTFYPSPRTAAGDTDYEGQFLKSVADKAGKSSCKAYLVHSLFAETRDLVINSLARLQTQGCKVKIILGENAIGDLIGSYFNMSLEARDLIDRVEFGNVHDKSITVSYTQGGVTYGTTWGGSSNLNKTSLEHDELAFRADDLTLTRAVEQQHERLYQMARGGKAAIPVTSVSVKPQAPSLLLNATLQLRASVSPADASVASVKWKSSNTAVATVTASGLVTGKGAGTATITATTVSGQKKGATTIAVSSDGNPTSPGAEADAVKISTPPTLTMDNWQSPATDKLETKIVVSWGRGEQDIAGKVALQYWVKGSTWKTWKTITTDSSGRWEDNTQFKSSKTWRAKAVSADKLYVEGVLQTKLDGTTPVSASVTDDGTYSAGYAYNVVQTKIATSSPKLYMPKMVKSGENITMVVAWKKPTAYPATIRVQYKTASGWKTKVTYDMDGSTKIFGVVGGSSRSWRVASSPKSGVKTVVSNSVKLTVK